MRLVHAAVVNKLTPDLKWKSSSSSSAIKGAIGFFVSIPALLCHKSGDQWSMLAYLLIACLRSSQEMFMLCPSIGGFFFTSTLKAEQQNPNHIGLVAYSSCVSTHWCFTSELMLFGLKEVTANALPLKVSHIFSEASQSNKIMENGLWFL